MALTGEATRDAARTLRVMVDAVRRASLVAALAQADVVERAASAGAGAQAAAPAAAAAAGAAAAGPLGRATKADASPVTAGDYAAQAVVLRALELGFPRTPVCAEEDGATLATLPDAVQRDVARRAAAQFPELGDVRELIRVLDLGGHNGFPAKPGAPFFVVDPIDGTKGFIRGEQFAVCVGLVDEDGRALAGCVGCPRLASAPEVVALTAKRARPRVEGSLFLAWRGQGAHEMVLFPDEPADAGARVPLPLPARAPKPGQVRSLESAEQSHKTPLVDDIKRACGATDMVLIDSQVKFCILARGEAEIFPRVNNHDQLIWDVLPGAIIATEAGCLVADRSGGQLVYTRGRWLGTSVVVSASTQAGPAMLERMVAAVRRGL